LRKSPGATAVAVLALALGIGVNTSCFIWVNALVLHPLPYPNLERIMALAESVPKLSAQRDLMVAPANALDWREQNHAFEQLSLYQPWDANLTGAHEPERIQACLVTANFFALLGMKPTLGRVFSKQEEEAAANPAVIVSHGFWQRRLASNPNAVGQSISLDNRSYTIAGVMPADFDYPLATDQGLRWRSVRKRRISATLIPCWCWAACSRGFPWPRLARRCRSSPAAWRHSIRKPTKGDPSVWCRCASSPTR